MKTLLIIAAGLGVVIYLNKNKTGSKIPSGVKRVARGATATRLNPSRLPSAYPSTENTEY